jgi:hypothetical protein
MAFNIAADGRLMATTRAPFGVVIETVKRSPVTLWACASAEDCPNAAATNKSANNGAITSLFITFPPLSPPQSACQSRPVSLFGVAFKLIRVKINLAKVPRGVPLSLIVKVL